MPPFKRKKKLSVCPNCKGKYERLNMHYFNKPVCEQWALNKDISVISDIPSIHQHHQQQFQTPLSLANFDFQHTHDVDSMLFGSNICQQINNEDEFDLNDTQSHISTLSESSSTCNDSTNSHNSTTHLSMSNTTTDCGIDAQLDSSGHTLNKLNIATTHHSQSITNTSDISQEMQCLIDFRSFQLSVFKQMTHFPIDQSIIASVKLLKIMMDSHIASCNYRRIIQWHNEVLLATQSLDCRSTLSLIKSKKRVLSILHEIMYTFISPKLSMKPIHTVMVLPSTQSTKISKLNLIGSLFSLLTDPDLMNVDNLLIHDKSFTDPNTSTTTTYNDIHHSSSFKTAHQHFCHDPIDVLIPVIPFIDGTPIDPYGRNKLEVVMFTLGIFNQSTRNKPSAWRVAGYIPDPTNCNSGETENTSQSQVQKAISKRKDYHAMLNYLLQDFIALEKSDGILIALPNKTKTNLITYRFKFVILYIIGDAVGNDKLCDRFASYGKSVKRLCRDCDCPTEHLDNHKYYCDYTKRSDLLQMSEKDLKDISYYKIDNNALDGLTFGYNKYGMNGCLPPEPLHQLNQGVFKKLVDYFEECLTSIGKDTLDKFVRYLSMNSHRQSTNDFPDIGLFKDGIDKCQLTGSEIITKVFMIYLCLVQTYVIESLPRLESTSKQRYKTKKSRQTISENDCDNIDDCTEPTELVTVTKHFYKKVGQSPAHLKDWIRLFEATLCFDAWVQQDEFSMDDIKETEEGKCDSKADLAIRQYMKLYTKMLDSNIGNGTKTSKIHWMLHIPRYIREHGPPKAYSGQTPEHCLSPLVKWAARLTQLRPSSLIEQSCDRYFENHIIQRSYEMLKHQNVIFTKTNDNHIMTNLTQQLQTGCQRSYVGIGRFRILFDENNQFTSIKWKSRSSQAQKYITQNPQIINDLIMQLHNSEYGLQSTFIDCCTTLNILDQNSKQKQMYRADPYFYKRPWNDWCESLWTVEGTSDTYPCRILMFIDTTNMSFTSLRKKNDRYYALVRASEKDERSNTQKKNKDCKLIKTYEADKYIRLINCKTIIKPIFVIPDIDSVEKNGTKLKYNAKHRIVLKDKHTWANMFINQEWV